MQHSWNCIAKTPTKEIVYTLAMVEVNAQGIAKMVHKSKFDGLCKLGCPNYDLKWSCPPLSPSYNEFIGGYNRLLICLMCTELNQFSYINNDYLKVKAANSILKSRIDKISRSLSLKYGKFISTGSCRLCKPCKRKLNKPCAHEDKMSFSFEALGVDVDEMTRAYFQHRLLWYSKGNFPSYTSVIAGLLVYENIDINLIIDEFHKLM